MLSYYAIMITNCSAKSIRRLPLTYLKGFKRCEYFFECTALLFGAIDCRMTIEELMSVVTELRVIAADDFDPLRVFWKIPLRRFDHFHRCNTVIAGEDLLYWNHNVG